MALIVVRKFLSSFSSVNEDSFRSEEENDSVLCNSLLTSVNLSVNLFLLVESQNDYHYNPAILTLLIVRCSLEGDEEHSREVEFLQLLHFKDVQGNSLMKFR